MNKVMSFRRGLVWSAIFLLTLCVPIYAPDAIVSARIESNIATVKGVFYSKKIAYMESRGFHYFSCDVTYSYEYGGRTYQGYRLNLDRVKPSTYREAEDSCSAYRSGAQINVFLDKNHPSFAVLDKFNLKRNVRDFLIMLISDVILIVLFVANKIINKERFVFIPKIVGARGGKG